MNIEVAHNRDNLKGMISSSAVMLLLFIFLKMINYNQIMTKEPAEDVIEVDKTPDEIVMPKFETSAAQGGGSGQPTDAPLSDKYEAQMDKTLRDPNSASDKTAAKGESNHSNQNNDSDNKASTTVDSDLAFKKSGGNGGGDNGGKGKGFGNDEGDGKGPGKGEGVQPRIRLNNPNTDNISSDESCKISLKLTINAEGDVIKAENIAGQSTTTKSAIINQVIKNVREQVKYNKKPGASPEYVFLTINIKSE